VQFAETKELVALAKDLNVAHAPKNGHSRGGYEESVQVCKTLPDNTTDDEKVVGQNTADLKTSSGNGDGYEPLFKSAVSGGNSSSGGTSHRDDRGSPSSSHATNSIVSTRSRVPYFRCFGPATIVSGFQQMAVQIKRSSPQCKLYRGVTRSAPNVFQA
jgi:hypothetical protein